MGIAQFIETETEFDALLSHDSLLVVDFTAIWCGPCRLITPFIDQLAETYQDRANVYKIDIDKHKAVAKKFGIKSIPAVLFFQDGQLIKTLIGSRTYEEFSQELESCIT